MHGLLVISHPISNWVSRVGPSCGRDSPYNEAAPMDLVSDRLLHQRCARVEGGWGVMSWQRLHPGRLTWEPADHAFRKGTWPSKPPWLCSMLIFRGVFFGGTVLFQKNHLICLRGMFWSWFIKRITSFFFVAKILVGWNHHHFFVPYAVNCSSLRWFFLINQWPVEVSISRGKTHLSNGSIFRNTPVDMENVPFFPRVSQR